MYKHNIPVPEPVDYLSLEELEAAGLLGLFENPAIDEAEEGISSSWLPY
jgi:hypothetical protein